MRKMHPMGAKMPFSLNCIKMITQIEIPQYYVHNSHPAIIPPEEFDLVQAEFLRRKNLGKQYNSSSVFSTRIICGDCGHFYGSKIWHSTSKYRRVIWQCNNKFNDNCNTPHLSEKVIKEKFLSALQKVIECKAAVIEDCELLLGTLTDCTELDLQLENHYREMNIISKLTQSFINENSRKVQDQDVYNEQYQALTERFEKEKTKADMVKQKKSERLAKRDLINGFIAKLKNQNELPFEFSEDLWIAMIDNVTIFADGRMVFKFKGDVKITEYM